jgi:hypothetical protein
MSSWRTAKKIDHPPIEVLRYALRKKSVNFLIGVTSAPRFACTCARFTAVVIAMG